MFRILIKAIILFLIYFFLINLFSFLEDIHSAKSKILERAKPYLPLLCQLVDKYWKGARKDYLAGQIEQESLWNPYAELKTSREYGVGLSQITVTKRFNKFEEAKKRYKELRNWAWEDRFDPKYQLTFLVLEDKRLFKLTGFCNYSEKDNYACAFVSYNAGFGTVLKRKAIAPKRYRNRWFGGLELICPYSKIKLYKYNLCDLQNRYPYLIIFIRSPKYKEWFEERGQM